jgi:hypothetical protein
MKCMCVCVCVVCVRERERERERDVDSLGFLTQSISLTHTPTFCTCIPGTAKHANKAEKALTKKKHSTSSPKRSVFKISMIHVESAIHKKLSQFAAFFIETKVEISVVES